MNPTPPSGRRGYGRFLLAGTVVVLIVAFFAFGLNRYFDWDTLRDHLDSLRAQVHANLALALLLFVLLYVAVTALSLPVATGLSLIAGALFGRWVGTAAVIGAATAGATLAFLGSRYIFRDFVERKFGHRLTAIQQGVERDGAYYLFTLRLVPLFPFFLVNLAMGLTRIRVATFAWVSFVGMLPGTFLFVNAGTEAGQIASPKEILSPTVLISFALLGIAPLLLRKLLRRG